MTDTTEKQTSGFGLKTFVVGAPLLMAGLVVFFILGPGKRSVEIARAIEVLSESLPMDVNEELTLISAKKNGSKVQLIYQLKDQNDPNLASFYVGVTPKEEAAEVCQVPDFRKILEWGTKWEIVYISSDSQEISRATIAMQDCEEIEAGDA